MYFQKSEITLLNQIIKKTKEKEITSNNTFKDSLQNMLNNYNNLDKVNSTKNNTNLTKDKNEKNKTINDI